MLQIISMNSLFLSSGIDKITKIIKIYTMSTMATTTKECLLFQVTSK